MPEHPEPKYYSRLQDMKTHVYSIFEEKRWVVGIEGGHGCLDCEAKCVHVLLLHAVSLHTLVRGVRERVHESVCVAFVARICLSMPVFLRVFACVSCVCLCMPAYACVCL